ncbi:MAG: DUF364 domain-containing protein [Eubacteriales bacterium]|nr:DUF364 domain-containing protein [Eubacteriales bacterium]
MILERVYELAKPCFQNRKVKDIRVGLGLMALELSDGLVGVTYVLNSEIKHTCEAIPQAGSLTGMPADEIAQWAVQGKNVITGAMGLAVLNAVAEFDKLEQYSNPQGADAVFSVDIEPEDTIGIIGRIGPVISRLQEKKNRMLIFERDESKGENIYPESAQPELLPKCQVVFVTSSTLINGTLEDLLKYCINARDIVMVGSSTPLYPEAFSGTGVTVLSGTRWLSSNSEKILEGVSQCAGIKQLMKYGQKISVRVTE